MTINLRWRNGYCYLVDFQHDTNNKRFEKTIVSFGKTKPKFHFPFIYQGSSNILTENIKKQTIDLILTDPPYGITPKKKRKRKIREKIKKK